MKSQPSPAQFVATESALLQLTRLRHEALASVTIVTADGATIHFDLSQRPTATGNQHLIDAAEEWYQRMWEVMWELADAKGVATMAIVQPARAQKL